VSVQVLLSVLLAYPVWSGDVGMTAEARSAMLEPVAAAIVGASSSRFEAAVLTATAWHECGLASYVLDDRCEDGADGARCDNGRARGRCTRGPAPSCTRSPSGPRNGSRSARGALSGCGAERGTGAEESTLTATWRGHSRRCEAGRPASREPRVSVPARCRP